MKKSGRKSGRKSGVKGNGGAREGSGRKPVYGEKLTKTIAFRLNGEQSTAAYDYCVRRGFEAMPLAREAVLEMARLGKLGLGVSNVARPEGVDKVGIKRGEKTLLPVKFTPAQEKGVIEYARKQKLHKGTLMKEALMVAIGRPDLGLQGEAKKATERAQRMSAAAT